MAPPDRNGLFRTSFRMPGSRQLEIESDEAPHGGEPGLDEALAAGEAARKRVVQLEERVTFLEEQLRSTRAYFAALAEGDLAELQRERVMLLEEIDILTEALRSALR